MTILERAMLVTEKNLEKVIEALRKQDYLGLDTETTGLQSYLHDRLFSLVISSVDGSFYFNFQPYADLSAEWVLPREEAFTKLSVLFKDSEKTWYIHNAKFDLSILMHEPVAIAGRVWDTEVYGRLQYNRYMKYGLDSLCEKIGERKDPTVEDYISKHKLYTWDKALGKEKKAKLKHYDRVPFEIMSKYGEKDGDLVYKLGEHQRLELARMTALSPNGSLTRVIKNEAELTKVCFAMEKIGIKIDRNYCTRGYDYEIGRAEEAAGKFEAITGEKFVDSGKALAKAFDAVGEVYPRTEKGNPSFKQDVLEKFESPLAQLVLDNRKAIKKASTYYANFLYFSDPHDRIHPNMRQAGTDTGRFSYSEPNLQNVPKEEDSPMLVRSAFIPTSDEWCFVMIDYDQMEYRLLLDYAAQLDVISKVLGGLDVHQATADRMGVSRKEAKTLNFLLLYGGGNEKLAHALDISVEKATSLKRSYFSQLPKIKSFTRKVIDRAETRGSIYNWTGRSYHFPFMKDPRTGKLSRFAHRSPNHIIQGGCADIVRYAMVECHAFLRDYRSRMLITVHDEILFEIHKSELDIVPELRNIMESAYPYKYLPMTCGVDHSWLNWGEKVKGLPQKIN